MSSTYPNPLKVGVFLVEGGIQLLDVAPVDMLGMLQKEYVQGMAQMTNQSLPADKGFDIEYYFINETGQSPNKMTGGFKIDVTSSPGDRTPRIPTVSISPFPFPVSHTRTHTHHIQLTQAPNPPQHSITTCPPLDIILLGGPMPNYRPSPAVQQFLRTQLAHVSAFLTVCTGCLPAVFSGILEGKRATAPQGLIPMLREQAPGVEWVEKRWVRDGKGESSSSSSSSSSSNVLSSGFGQRGADFEGCVVWTSGAVANGQEMMGAFMRESFPELRAEVEMVLGASDIAVRGTEYGAA
ncbi:MAG: hypothetical protein LQ346_004440 [Caloplaca aetnensis]|nr:MAG: hypothetical protein LQ346_004440 [Caloplaca aetnensis]